MSSLGDSLSGFVGCLYWTIGVLAGIVVILLAVVAWLVLR
jgi:hypothetical protein